MQRNQKLIGKFGYKTLRVRIKKQMDRKRNKQRNGGEKRRNSEMFMQVTKTKYGLSIRQADEKLDIWKHLTVVLNGMLVLHNCINTR